MKISRPIILFGAPSSGTSIMHDVFVRHPSVAFLNWRMVAKNPGRPERMHWLLRALDVPVLGRQIDARIRPGECYPFWHAHFGGFTRPHRDLTEDDLSERTRTSLLTALEKIPTERRHRLVLKVTGWPRLGFLNALFPDATFLHIVRDGRSVASSLVSRPFFDGWYGPQNWRFGELPPDQEALWISHGRSFVALAGIAWNILERATRDTRSMVAGRIFDVRYEDFCADPARTLDAMADLSELSRAASHRNAVLARTIHERRTFERDLTKRQIDVLEAVLDDQAMRSFGYRGT